ncbi:DUF4097 family beta strand repeat-containing protein [Carboxylicivirga litoralis]|uniref:DUF4097 family beta strand repeat-containing protein n=1 Tax=Carboxylicivirga litoralis TaxID=2816963 RepID=UPI0021CAEA84|nr:DUF4097 family beta strand repeat-containing protein [Carboxylicivirga sp. A043]
MRKTYLLLLLLLPISLMAQDMPVVANANQSFENITSVKIIGEFSKVTVNAGDKLNIDAELRAAKELEGYAVNCMEEAGALKIEVKKPESGWTSHTGFVNVTLPAGVKLDIETTSGYITLKGLSGADVVAQSKSGKIQATDINANVTLRSRSASIKAENIKGQLNTKSKGGDHVIRHVDGAVSLYSSSGEMIVEHINGSLKTESTDGTQTVKEVNGDIYLKTKSAALKLSDAKGTIGSLSVSGTLNLFNVEGVFNLVATKGSIIGSRVKLNESSSFNTTEGKIKIKFMNPKEQFTFACQSEHAYIVAYGKSKKKKLKLGDGPIVVTAISTTGAMNFNKQ